MSEADRSLEELSINTIRTLAIDAVQKANSGHPGLPLGAARMAYVLWQHHLRHNPKDPHWPNRDRFVLSAGHGSMLLYALLHLTGYDLSMDDLQSFRQWSSRTPGHPEARLTPGVEATTGPLGQGTANAIGMAIAERALAHHFNRPGHTVVDHRTYAIVSDGDVMEGISSEASSLGGHLQLGKLVFLYDCNHVSLDGPTSLTFSTEDVAARYKAYGWHVCEVTDGDTDSGAIEAAIAAAEAETTRPSFIVVRTTIGYGSPNKQGTSEAHGSPLGVEEVKLTKKALGWDPERSFYVPEAAGAHFRTAVERGARAQAEWEQRVEAYGRAYPELAEEWRRALRGEMPDGWDRDLPTWKAGEELATRQAGGKAMNAIAARVPWLMGGDGDLSVSTSTALKDAGSFDGQTGAGRNFHFGVREHAMGAIANGMAYHGGVRPFAATFFVFSDYMRPAVRLAALNELPVIFVWTHDSIGLGEDGPTHQPIEHLMSLRAMPHLSVIRPCDANETAEAWRWAMAHGEGPVALVLSRQKLPVLDRSRLGAAAGLARGAYVLADADGGAPQAIVIATGSEVHVALGAHQLLANDGIRARVVSMPCWETFAAQSAQYRDAVLPASVRARVSVEAGVTFGWSQWIGDSGTAIGVDRFGSSAPGETNMEKFGFTPENVARIVRALLDREKS
ncbi:MAG TPA: transketolase, partial [Candidatus Acidoferrales bacterium]|nr:transketolase [Candidatus Acidoferrales bacterium]